MEGMSGTIQILKEDIGEFLFNISIGKGILTVTQNPKVIRENADKCFQK